MSAQTGRNCSCTLATLRTLVQVEQLQQQEQRMSTGLDMSLELAEQCESACLRVLACGHCRGQRFALIGCTALSTCILDVLAKATANATSAVSNSNNNIVNASTSTPRPPCSSQPQSTVGSLPTPVWPIPTSSLAAVTDSDAAMGLDSPPPSAVSTPTITMSIGSYHLDWADAATLLRELVSLRLGNLSEVMVSLESAIVGLGSAADPACLDAVRVNLHQLGLLRQRLSEPPEP
ncbi:hypothetical protein HDK64DRAFT_252955 [Phyllosticta capitalensis]